MFKVCVPFCLKLFPTCLQFLHLQYIQNFRSHKHKYRLLCLKTKALQHLVHLKLFYESSNSFCISEI